MNTYEDLILVCDGKGQHYEIPLARFAKEDPNSDSGDWSNYIFVSQRVRVAGRLLEAKRASFDDEKGLVLKCKCGRETRINRETLEKLALHFISKREFKINISRLPF
jgi:hypothetical protein